MIKYFIALMIAFLAGSAADAQNTVKADPRLYECLTAAEILQAETSQPALIQYYNFFLDHSYYVVSLKSEKPVTGTDIHTLKLRDGKGLFAESSFDAETLNALKFDLNLSQNSFTTYVWKEAGIALVFYPLSHIAADFKNSQGSTR